MDEVQLIAWAVNNEDYAVEIEDVQEIIRVMPITRMPLSRDCLPGVINLRGRVIPIMDMAKRLHLPGSLLSDLSRIIVVQKSGITAGLLVDRASEILKIDSSFIEPRDLLSSAQSNKYVKAIGKWGKRVLLILDMERIFEINHKNEI